MMVVRRQDAYVLERKKTKSIMLTELSAGHDLVHSLQSLVSLVTSKDPSLYDNYLFSHQGRRNAIRVLMALRRNVS